MTFAITVTSEATGNDTPMQSATIKEEDTADDKGTFTITLGGDALTGTNTATVTVSIDGTSTTENGAVDGDFTAAVIAAIEAAVDADATITKGTVTATSVELTFEVGGSTSLSVDLTAFDDDLTDSPEFLKLALSGETVDDGTAALVGGKEDATLTIEDQDADVTFAITVDSDVTGNDVPTQAATIIEEDNADDEGQFQIMLNGGPLVTGNTASVTVTIGGDGAGGNGTAMDADFTANVIAAISTGATAASVGFVDNGNGTVTLTWDSGSSATVLVDLEAVDDDLIDSPETLTLSLSGATVADGSASISGTGTADLTITDNDVLSLFGKILINEVALSGLGLSPDGNMVAYIEVRSIVNNASQTPGSAIDQLSFEIVGPDGTVFIINSEGQFGQNIPAKGYLTLYADGTWARTTPAGTTTHTGRWDAVAPTNFSNTTILPDGSGIYDWGFGADTSAKLVVNMLQSGSSIDILLANDPDLTEISSLGLWVPVTTDPDHDTFDGSLTDDQVFARVFTQATGTPDTHSEADWTTWNTATDRELNSDSADPLDPQQSTSGSDAALVVDGGQTVLFGVPGTSDGDLLEGRDGPDFLFGTSDSETLIGGAHDDSLTGGTGNDTFLYTSTGDGDDTILDFVSADGDVVDLNALFDALGAGTADARAALVDITSNVLTIDGDTGTGGNQPIADFSITFAGTSDTFTDKFGFTDAELQALGIDVGTF